MYEKIENCPSCNSKEFINHIICDDFLVSNESFAIVKCKNCSLLITTPRPDRNSIDKYYQSEDYISHTDASNNLINIVYKFARNYTLRKKFNFINKISKSNSILDYGCGTGYLLKYFKNKNWKTTGIEPDSSAREISINKQGLEVHSSLDDLSNNKYGVISLWHVLEHVHDLNATIQKLHKKLSADGKLVIAIPNHDSYDQKIYKQHWAAYDIPRHLYHFNQLSIKELMKYNRFELIDTKPMVLDAYYVSMLSEKHKNRKNSLFRSILNGWKSNQWARKNNKNYSSLIYIFKKA